MTDLESPLREHLVLFPPDANRRIPSLAFKRTREVELSWEEMLGPTGPLEPSDRFDAGRVFLERLWGIDAEAPGYPTDDDVGRAKDSVVRVTEASITLTVGFAGQTYTLVAKDDAPFASDEFSSRENYERVWTKVGRIDVPVESATAFEEVDLAAPVILQQYRELAGLRDLAEKISDSANDVFDEQLKVPLSKPELDALMAKYKAMKDPLAEIERRLARLRDGASDLGYVLNVGKTDEVFTYPDGKDPIVIKPGKLYRPYATVVTWIVSHVHRAVVTRRFLFWTDRRVVSIPYAVHHAQVVTKYREEIIDLDPWVEKERALAEMGKRSFRFERQGDRYFTNDGTMLADVMLRCERDKEFWSSCVIWIPVYEQKLTEGEALVRYLLIHRPLTGVESVALPRLFLQEDLAVKSKSATTVELGSLLHTINLAPGEERTITIERSMSREQETTRTATSLIDLADVTQTDFATEFENEARNEKESTNSSNWNASASGGWGPFSASAGGGGSSSKTSRQFARDLQRIATKASRNVSRKTREEVSVSSSVKTTVTSRESTAIDVVNNNDGRTLNLAFYQLMNVHKMGIYLEGLRFVVFTGVEDVAGSGIVMPKTFGLDELEPMLGALAFAAMPFREKGSREDWMRRRLAYVRLVLLDLLRVLREYAVVPATPKPDEKPPVTIPDLLAIEAEVQRFDPDAADAAAALGTIVRGLQAALSDIIYTDAAIGPDGEQDLVVGSAGLYLDSFVGIHPSTEPYAEDMRQREVRLKDAQISEILARADAHRSLANGGMPIGGDGALQRVDSDGERKLTLQFLNEPRQGEWELWVESLRTDKILKAVPKERQYTIEFPEKQAWLTSDVKNLCRLVHRVTRETVHFLV